ncbi:MAG: sulfur carrier protein ThiS [Deltaproteobacteria bacterium]|nr:sulfur carrier protein ThiS [Deltaproteobacteria bacterium]
MKREKGEIEIIVNGFKERVPNRATIAFLLRHFEEETPHLIVEHNGEFVHPEEYFGRTVSEGDKLEFLNPAFGG